MVAKKSVDKSPTDGYDGYGNGFSTAFRKIGIDKEVSLDRIDEEFLEEPGCVEWAC